jgi:hypothetical protein
MLTETYVDLDDLGPLLLIWLTLGMVMLIANNPIAFWDHVERSFIAHFRRLTPGWVVFVATMAAILVWPFLPFVMAKVRRLRGM